MHQVPLPTLNVLQETQRIFLCHNSNTTLTTTTPNLGYPCSPQVSLPPWFGRGHHQQNQNPEVFQPPLEVSALTFLFSRELFCLFPDFSGIEEVGGDLDVAGSHLMDALRDRHRGPAPWRVGWPGRVISWIPWRQLWRDWRWHPHRFAAHPERKMELERQKRTSFRHVVLWDVP